MILVDAGDWLHLSALANLVSAAKEQCADIVTCDYNVVLGDNVIRYYRKIAGVRTEDFLNSYLAYGMASSCGCLIRKNVCVNNNLSFTIGVKYGEDMCFMGQLLFSSEKKYHLKEAYYNYLQRSTSLTHNFNRETRANEIHVCQYLITFYKANGVGEHYEQIMSWKLLKSTQELVLSPENHKGFVDLRSEIKNDDMGLPFDK